MPDIRRPVKSFNHTASPLNSHQPAEMPVSDFNYSHNQAADAEPNKQRRLVWVGGVIIFVIFLAVVIKLITGSLFGWWGPADQSWQAVFLSNNTVYFGRVTDQGSWLLLHDIYYLQRAQTPQPSGEEQVDGQNKLVLIKLGNELHGPEDYMKINKDHVIFIENLKADSQVTKAIANYLQNQRQ